MEMVGGQGPKEYLVAIKWELRAQTGWLCSARWR